MVYSRIIATGSYLPDKVVTNFDLYKIKDVRENFLLDEEKLKQEKEGIVFNSDEQVFDNWVRRMTGVSERRYTDITTEEMGARAALKAIETAGISPKDIDRIYFETFTPSEFVNNAGGACGEMIGATGVPAEQSTTACSSFLYSLEKAYNGIRAGTYENVLIVCSESLSKTIRWNDPKTSVLWGDGAAAVVVQATNNLESKLHSVPYIENFDSSNIQYDNPLVKRKLFDEEITFTSIEMKGKNVFESAHDALFRTIFGALMYSYDFEQGRKYMKENREEFFRNRKFMLREFKEKGLDELLGKLVANNMALFLHQANERIIQIVARSLDIDFSKFYMTIGKYANTSGASIPLAMDKAIEEGSLKKGQLFLASAVGGSYPAGAVIGRL